MAIFTVHVLCYGDFPRLARRCLASVVRTADWEAIAQVRVALARCGEPTRQYVHEVARALPGRVAIYDLGEANPGKYSVMRRLFYGVPAPGLDVGARTTSRLLWLDDDSFIKPATRQAWWGRVLDLAQQYTLIGAHYTQNLTPGQRQAIRDQPWYAGRDRPTAHFVQGGWWVADPVFLKRWDYPFPELRHNGGDVILGELCYQQRQPVLWFQDGFATNAGEAGENSTCPRRGMAQRPLWAAYEPGAPASLAHHVWDWAEITDYASQGA